MKKKITSNRLLVLMACFVLFANIAICRTPTWQTLRPMVLQAESILIGTFISADATETIVRDRYRKMLATVKVIEPIKNVNKGDIVTFSYLKLEGKPVDNEWNVINPKTNQQNYLIFLQKKEYSKEREPELWPVTKPDSAYSVIELNTNNVTFREFSGMAYSSKEDLAEIGTNLWEELDSCYIQRKFVIPWMETYAYIRMLIDKEGVLCPEGVSALKSYCETVIEETLNDYKKTVPMNRRTKPLTRRPKGRTSG